MYLLTNGQVPADWYQFDDVMIILVMTFVTMCYGVCGEVCGGVCGGVCGAVMVYVYVCVCLSVCVYTTILHVFVTTYISVGYLSWLTAICRSVHQQINWFNIDIMDTQTDVWCVCVCVCVYGVLYENKDCAVTDIHFIFISSTTELSE